ncbi:hypothetical protein F2Q69_00042526 [Brassica cretica]|uniref:Uncharacterized protein n=1 Tax=Brassica cretica TaxID=69181 RepID=A0A8S9NKG5_BRACR|nr:hypothetical protein F2Q69_00042526 [Brassica cretica]
MLLVCGLVSIDAREVSIAVRAQVVSIDEEKMWIYAACYSLRIVRSSLAGSENKRSFSLLLLVLLGCT